MKQVIITGGSRGIGAAAVRAFSARGDQVAFLYEKEVEQAAAVAAETGALAIRCDVSDEAAVNAAFAQLSGTDILINNAGIADYDLINVITPERWRRLFAVNVDGAFYCIRAALPHMLRQQSGCILNVSSMWGQVGASCEAAYSATKGAILALTKALAQELGPSGIRVNASRRAHSDRHVRACRPRRHGEPAAADAHRAAGHAGGYRAVDGLSGRCRVYYRAGPARQWRIRHYLNLLLQRRNP